MPGLENSYFYFEVCFNWILWIVNKFSFFTKRWVQILLLFWHFLFVCLHIFPAFLFYFDLLIRNCYKMFTNLKFLRRSQPMRPTLTSYSAKLFLDYRPRRIKNWLLRRYFWHFTVTFMSIQLFASHFSFVWPLKYKLKWRTESSRANLRGSRRRGARTRTNLHRLVRGASRMRETTSLPAGADGATVVAYNNVVKTFSHIKLDRLKTSHQQTPSCQISVQQKLHCLYPVCLLWYVLRNGKIETPTHERCRLSRSKKTIISLSLLITSWFVHVCCF